MKNLLLSAAVVLTAVSAMAQNPIVNNPDNKPYLGVRLSVDGTIPGDIKSGIVSVDKFNHGAGLSVGAVYNYPVVANFYVEPGVSLYYDTYAINHEVFDDVVDVKHASLRQFGLKVPVMLGYHFDFSPKFNLGVFTGPELNVGFSNDEYVTTSAQVEPGVKVEVHSAPSVYGDNGYMNRVDCGWKIGVGANICKNYYVSLSGTIGMTNVLKNYNGATMHNNGFQLTLGYNF